MYGQGPIELCSYNDDRAHSSLDDVTPVQAYLELLPKARESRIE